MYTKTTAMAARSVLALATAAASLLICANVSAANREVTVAYHVSTKGLDLSQVADARKFYQRIEHAAGVVCTHGNRVGLEPSPDVMACSERALGDAIRSIKLPLLTQIYLETHTLREAAARGIDVPVQMAAK